MVAMVIPARPPIFRILYLQRARRVAPRASLQHPGCIADCDARSTAQLRIRLKSLVLSASRQPKLQPKIRIHEL
jgi:hypothetical protein